MVQVVIYGHRDRLQHIAEPIIAEIDSCLVDTLKYPTGRRYYRFIPLESWAFVYPDDRTDKYTIVEITLFAGRAQNTLRQLIQDLYRCTRARLNVQAADIEFIIHEVSRANWGLRGQPADELELGYQVDV